MVRRTVVLVLVALLCLSCMAGSPACALKVKDAAGKEIEIMPPVKRVVFLSLYELIPVFDVWDSVIGVNRWAYDNELMRGFPQLREIPSLGTSDSLNLEALLALKPELVITWSYKPEVAEFLIRKGLKVISVYPDSLEQLYAVLDLCGLLFKKEERAREVRSLMEESFAKVAARISDIPGAKRKRVVWLWQKPTIVSGGIGLQQDLITLVGAVNPAEGLRVKHPEVSMESIVAWNPEVIFIWGSARFEPKDILSSPQWASIKAVREKKVFKAPALTTWSPTVASLALWVSWKVYPECYDPAVLAEEVRRFHENCFGIPLEGFTFN